MIAMGEYASGQLPFHETFVHGLIYGKSYWRNNEDGSIAYVLPEERLAYELGEPVPDDVFSKWEKMSKSKGNVINPIEIIDEYGADAMRLALTSTVTHARQIDLDRRRFEEFKNFANKVWNASRFVFMNLEENEKTAMPALSQSDFEKGLDRSLFTLEDQWILSRLGNAIERVEKAFDGYNFDIIAKASYNFFWDEFCAYYLEAAKPYLFGKVGTKEIRANKQKILIVVMLASIRLLHPIAPFITEELFSLLKSRFTLLKGDDECDEYIKDAILALKSDVLALTPFPRVIELRDISSEIETTWDCVCEIVYAIRNIRAEMQIPPSTLTDVYICGKSANIEPHKEIILALVRVRKMEFSGEVEPELSHASTAFVKEMKIIIPLPEDLKTKEKNRLEKELIKHSKQIDQLSAKLSNSSFTERAPENLVNKTRSTLLDLKDKKKEIEVKLLSL